MPRMVEGEAAAVALAAALARVTGLVPHLSAAVEPAGVAVAGPGAAADRPVPADREWVPCAALIDDPAWLARIISSTGHGIGTDDPVVAASVFVQGYSYRVLALTVACLMTSGVVPDASSPSMAFALLDHWPSQMAFTRPRVMTLDGPHSVAAMAADSGAITDALRFVADQAVDRHLGPLIRSVRTGVDVAIGQRLLWGNVAASAATAFRTMEGCLGRVVVPLGERFFTLAPPSLQGLGSFIDIESDRRRGWFWERTNCCLFDRVPGVVRCADCSLTPAHQRRQAYRDSLEAT